MYFKRAVGLTAVLTLIILVGVAYAAELVGNGDFSNGTTGWTLSGSDSGTGYPGDCAVNQLYLADAYPSTIATAIQCINITSHGSAWTLALDVISLIGGTNTLQGTATFFNNAACGGGVLHSASTSTTSSPTSLTQGIPFDTSVTPAGSVQVLVQAGDTGNADIGVCVDNVSLSADGATAVSLQNINANQMPNLWLFIPLIALLFAATTAVIQYTNRKEAK